jgi:hypothetical protein
MSVGLALLVSSAAQAGAVLHVDDDASLGGDGSSWASAYKYLQDALAAETAAPTRKAPASASPGAGLPMAFVPNEGQWDTPARFVAHRGPMVARLEKDAIVLQLATRHENGQGKGVVVRLAFEGAAEDVAITGQQRQPGRYNFFLSSDRSQWRTDVPAYGQVLYRGLYDGVDLRVRDEAGRLEYDLVLAPGADLSQVTVRGEGIDGLDIDAEGSLVMQTALGPITQKPPIAWYELPSGERHPVESRFCTFDERTFGFEVPGSDSKHTLVIDPPLEWSTFLGGDDNGDGVWALEVDALGIVTVGGWAFSTDFPTTPGAYDETFNPPYSMFVARLDPEQVGDDQLLWSTFIGGRGEKLLFDLATDDSGIVTVVGMTTASDFPTTSGAYDTTHNGAYDAFALRLDPDQVGVDQLLWSTYLGGLLDDWAADVDVNDAGAVIVSGFTFSDSFPTTKGAYDTSFNGGDQDAFVARLDPEQIGDAQLVWSTFLGGTGREGSAFDPLALGTDSMGVVVDDLGVVTVSGGTTSSDFPTTPGAYDTSYNGGGGDGFVSRLSADGSTLVWSTYLGGSSGQEPGWALVVDAAGVVTTVGYTWSHNFPTTDGAYDRDHDASNDGFVARLDPSLVGPAQLVYSTFIGGASWDPVFDIALDSSGVVTAAGATNSPNFPTTPYAYDPSHNGGDDGFVFRLSPDGSGADDLLYSTYLGGSNFDAAVSLALHGPDDVIVGGWTQSADFPTTSGAYDEIFPGTQAGFVVKLHLTPCPWDCNLPRDGQVNVSDFLALLSQWGNVGSSCDIDGGGVGVTDFLALLAWWGPCP